MPLWEEPDDWPSLGLVDIELSIGLGFPRGLSERIAAQA
jgi:hypothetical protein